MKRTGPSLSRLGSKTGWLLVALTAVSGAAAVAVGCSSDEAVTSPGGSSQSTTGAGGAATTSTTATTATTSGAGGAGGATATSTSSAGGAGGGTTTTGAGGAGGEGGAGGAWPTCDAQPVNVPSRSLHQIWTSNPAQPSEAWLPGVFVTAISQGGCQAGAPCQLFVQQKESFANLAAGSQQALKLFVSKNAAQYFTSVKVGDQVDALAWGVRDATTNELMLEVTLQYKGCAKTVGAGALVPVSATLGDLTVDAYENTLGPLFVQVAGVSGKPQTPTEIFALWTTGMFNDAGIDAIVNLSPYFLAGGAFSGFTQGKTHDFTTIAGVFGVVPEGMPAVKYKVIYPRTMADVVIGQVQP